MTLLRTFSFPLLAAIALLPACNLGPGGDDDDATDDDDAADDDDAGDDAVPTTIKELNAGDLMEDTLVSITGAIVTGVYIVDDNFVTFWVQDALGGPGAGMTISTFADVLEEFDPDQALFLGDILDITGRFQLAFEEEVPRISVDNSANMTITGYTELPLPHLVDADDISGGFAARDLWGLSVGVEDVTVETAPTFENYGVFEADGVLVDDIFYWPDVEVGDALSSLSGIMTPWYGDATLLPRWDDDVWFEPAGCEAVLEGDDDSVQEVNCRRYFEGEEVTLEGLVVISGETWSGGNFFAQDTTDRDFGGILVYAGEGATIPADGAVVNLTGEYTEFRGQTEIGIWDDEDLVDTGSSEKYSASAVADACSVGEAHEGTLVTITSDVVLGEQSDWEAERGYYPVEGCTRLLVGSLFFDDGAAFDAANGGVGTITGLTGVVSDRYELLFINPRSTDDWTDWVSAAE